uniref:HDC03027 n=1 Tax=Drosophila melanogaster TaxID=7227 RepID=Q6IH83_DROME|nr:TPA_inf: HDC03027 [Drosophila melanogaster]
MIWLPNHKRHPKANSEAKSAAPSSDTDFPAAPGAVNTQLSGLSITRIYGSRYSSWSDLSVVASRCSESDPQLISLLQSGDRWPQHFTHFPLDFKNNLCSILCGDVGQVHMAGTVDIVRYIYIWQATPACPEKGTTLVETAPLDWFLKWLEAVTAASAKYALNAQSVRNALRLPGKKGEGQAK